MQTHRFWCSSTAPAAVFFGIIGGSGATFPNHIVISPAYGTNTAFVPPAYIRESQQQAARVLGHPLAKPMLIGLSAGGFGAARAYVSSHSAYRATVILVAYPPPEILGSTDARHDLRLLAGGDEFYIRDGTWNVALGRLKKRGVRISAQVIPAAGHFSS
jgi:hypothetical protein